METETIPYTLAEGPEGLRKVLDEFLDKTLLDHEFAAQTHYVLYQLGSQKSLIKLDMSQKPYQFWYYDLLGRPATRIVKETIATFLAEKCDEQGLFMESDEGL